MAASVRPAGIAIAHDYFDIRGGGERLVLRAAAELGADLCCGFRTAQSYDASMFPRGTVELGLWDFFKRPQLRVPALAMRFRGERTRMERYSTRIFSGVSAPFAAPDRGRTGRNIYYCHTPPRFLYDQREHFRTGTNPLRDLALGWYRRGYEAAVERMDVIVANSETVRHRIQTYLGRDSVVIHPPCDTDAFRWRGQGDYYLSTARLSPLKRVNRIVEAFLGMPDKRLIVASGGDELGRLKQLAAGADNIEILGWVSETAMQQLVGEAIATIYVPIDEDFGMSPVESMAAGKPVIGVAEAGLTETVIEDETGALLPPDFTTDLLRDAVRKMTPARAAAMRTASEARAVQFSVARFVGALREIVGA